MTDEEIQRIINIYFSKIKVDEETKEAVLSIAKQVERTTRNTAMQLAYDCANQINNMNKEAL